MNRRWLALPERGSTWSMKLIVFIGLRLGRPLGRLLLWPITGYFLLTANPEVRRSSSQFLQRATGRPAGWWQFARHLLCYAQTILDRVFFLTGQLQHFDFQVDNGDVILQRVRAGQGVILLGAHLGSFEALRAVGGISEDLPIKILMNVDHNEKISTVLAALNPQLAAAVIPLGGLGSLLQVKEHLEQGYIIGMLADRVVANAKSAYCQCQFMGGSVALPTGPIQLAAALQCPVILGFGLLRGNGRYSIHFELLADRIDIPRAHRQDHLRQWMQRYANRLEHFALMAPYNWFNFYDYWSTSDNQGDG